MKIGQPVLEKNNFNVSFVRLPWKPELCIDPKNRRNSGKVIEINAFCEVSHPIEPYVTEEKMLTDTRKTTNDG